jgi:hypothetical protein
MSADTVPDTVKNLWRVSLSCANSSGRRGEPT